MDSGVLASGVRRLSEPRFSGDSLFVLETRPDQGGRTTLLRVPLRADLPVVDCLPGPWSARTRVHEYGGGAYCLSDGTPSAGLAPGESPPAFAFSNDSDRRIYLGTATSPPRPLSPEDASLRYADFRFDLPRQRLVSVVEHHADTPSLPKNILAAISLSDGRLTPLVQGADFYSDPHVSPDGRSLLWLEWDQPDMPWDATRLCVASMGADGRPGGARMLAGGGSVSVFQPRWLADGSIVYVSDETGWWNLRCITADGQASRAMLPMTAEFGRPQWVFGMSTWAQLSSGGLFSTYNRKGSWHAGVLGTDGALSELPLAFCDFSDVTAAGAVVAFVAGSPTQPPSLFTYTLCDDMQGGELKERRRSVDVVMNAEDVSVAESLTFPCDHGDLGQAFFYPPANARYRLLPDERPPVLLRAHGGPTAAASGALRLDIQYWTTRGFAVLDVNYRGSTGFGRQYRDALRGQWGQADVKDCLSALRLLAEAGRIDPQRTAFSGGSAGGLTVLSALAFYDDIKAGAVYYGVGDLTALAAHTHKFELRYLDRLVGPYPEAAALFRARSPLFAADGIRAPVILFQGLDDRVVPPEQTRAIESALRARGLKVTAHYFPGEGHGFRAAGVIRKTLKAELEFYLDVFGIPGGPLPGG